MLAFMTSQEFGGQRDFVRELSYVYGFFPVVVGYLWYRALHIAQLYHQYYNMLTFYKLSTCSMGRLLFAIICSARAGATHTISSNSPQFAGSAPR